jgi:hypothetical protein
MILVPFFVALIRKLLLVDRALFQYYVHFSIEPISKETAFALSKSRQFDMSMSFQLDSNVSSA